MRGAARAERKGPSLPRPGKLEIDFDETVDASLASQAILVDGGVVAWTRSASGYQMVADVALTAGSHEVEIGTGAIDLASKGLGVDFSQAVILEALAYRILFQPIDMREVSVSVVLNTDGFHGMPRDYETGLIYSRNRYYDPLMAKFISVDPMGFFDGPSVYAFARHSPISLADRLGLYATEQEIIDELNRMDSKILKLDPELSKILFNIDQAAIEASRLSGLHTLEDVKAHGSKGSTVHSAMEKLLSKGGKYYHDRILTEVATDSDGLIRSFGVKKTDVDWRIIDIGILPRNIDRSQVVLKGTKAEDLQMLIEDLKMGKRGADPRAGVTLARYGSQINVFKPYTKWMPSSESLSKFLKYLGSLSAVIQFKRYLDEGKGLDEALKSATNLDIAEEAIKVVGDEAEARVQGWADHGNISRSSRRASSIDAVEEAMKDGSGQ